MDQRHLSGDVFDLVALQMADNVPLDGFPHLRQFRYQLLDIIFSENRLSSLEGGNDISRRAGL